MKMKRRMAIVLSLLYDWEPSRLYWYFIQFKAKMIKKDLNLNYKSQMNTSKSIKLEILKNPLKELLK